MSASLHVLVVEDNPVNQKVVMGLLAKWGHRSIVAGDGAQGLAALERHVFDLVLMDIQMPVMDGIAATCSIRAREREQGGHVPIIAITAHAATQDRVRCLEAGVDRYLTKPLNSALLRQAIAELLPDHEVDPGARPEEAGSGAVDFELLRGYVGEDPELLADVIDIFLDDAPRTLADAALAIAGADAARLEATAHRLKGSLATMGATAAAETASRIEAMGRDGTMAEAAPLWQRLSAEVDAVIACLVLARDRPAA